MILGASERGGTKTIRHVPIAELVHSRFNARQSRGQDAVARLAERMKRNGFEITRAPWAYRNCSSWEVFAGGTRLEAARVAGLETIPIIVHEGFDDDAIVRLADEDNENDEYHTPVSVLDVWAEYHRLWKTEGWTQARIAEAKGVDRAAVVRRCGWHTSLPASARAAVCDGILDEGHCEALSSVTCDVAPLAAWLTTNVAQAELVAEVLSKHRGSSAGIKPTVKVVREAAHRYKTMIAAAVAAFEDLDEDWRGPFVEELGTRSARSESAVAACLGTIKKKIAAEARRLEDEARAAAGEAEAEALRREREAEAEARVQEMVSRIVLGDAREHAATAPAGATLVAIDPPYGVDYQSGRRTASSKKSKISNDEDPQAAADLVRDVLAALFPRLAPDSTALVFTGWRHEPLFRTAVEAAGFTLKGSLVWVKHNHGTGDLRGSFAPKHERILHAVKGSPELRDRIPDVIEAKDQQNSDHPTEKPQALLEKLIRATTSDGDIVVDLFAGSGSTLFAAHACGRVPWGVELDAAWHRKISDRLLRIARGEDE